jgi:hypothetical protein
LNGGVVYQTVSRTMLNSVDSCGGNPVSGLVNFGHQFFSGVAADTLHELPSEMLVLPPGLAQELKFLKDRSEMGRSRLPRPVLGIAEMYRADVQALHRG